MDGTVDTNSDGGQMQNALKKALKPNYTLGGGLE